MPKSIEQRRKDEIKKIEQAYLTKLEEGICDGCGREGLIDPDEGICSECTACAIREIENGDLDVLLD